MSKLTPKIIKDGVILAILVVCITSCAPSKNYKVKLEEWNTNITSNIPIGTPKDSVEQYLKSSGVEYSYHEQTNAFYARDSDVNNRWVMYDAMIIISIFMDEENKVKSYKIKDEYSGL